MTANDDRPHDDSHDVDDQVDDAADEPVDAADEPVTAAPAPAAAGPIPSATARILSSIVDALVTVVLYYLVGGVIAGLAFHPSSAHPLTVAQAQVVVLSALAIVALAFVVAHRLLGYSLGNRVTSTALIGPDGRRPGWGRLLAKYLVMFGLLVIGFPFTAPVVLLCLLAAAWQRQRRNVFDQLTGIHVQSTAPNAQLAP